MGIRPFPQVQNFTGKNYQLPAKRSFTKYEKDKLMKLFSNANATKEEFVQLAKENKLKWVYDISLRNIQSKEEFNRNMNISLAHYLSN